MTYLERCYYIHEPSEGKGITTKKSDLASAGPSYFSIKHYHYCEHFESNDTMEIHAIAMLLSPVLPNIFYVMLTVSLLEPTQCCCLNALSRTRLNCTLCFASFSATAFITFLTATV